MAHTSASSQITSGRTRRQPGLRNPRPRAPSVVSASREYVASIILVGSAMNARARFSVLFTLLGVSMAAASVSYTWPLLVLLAWFGGSFVVVGIAYAAASSRLFGKRPNGTFSPYASVLLAPYLS